MHHLIGRFSRRFVLCALVGLAVVGGVAYAATSDGGVTYHGCVHKSTGALRIVDATGPQCNANTETAITFNEKGPKGDPGPQGEPGEKGDTGPAGKDATPSAAYERHTRATTLAEQIDLPVQQPTDAAAPFTVPAGSYVLGATVNVGITGSGSSAQVACQIVASGGGIPIAQGVAVVDDPASLNFVSTVESVASGPIAVTFTSPRDLKVVCVTIRSSGPTPFIVQTNFVAQRVDSINP